MTHNHMNQPSQILPLLFLAHPLRNFVVRLHSPGMLKHRRICSSQLGRVTEEEEQEEGVEEEEG